MLVAASGVASIAFFVGIATLFLLGAIFCIRSDFPIHLLILAVAGLHYTSLTEAISDAEINRIVNQLPAHDVQVIGLVASIPEFYPDARGDSGSWSFSLRCEGADVTGRWGKYRGFIDVRIRGEEQDPIVRYKQRILLNGQLDKTLFPGGKLIQIRPDQLNILAEPIMPPVVAIGHSWRDLAARQLNLEMESMPEQKAVLKALVLGYRKGVPSEIIDLFRRTGTMHIFAISGLHVGIVGLFLMILLKTLGISRDHFGLWLVPLLALYVISTGMKPSAVRALTMAGVFVLAPRFRCRPDIPSSVAFAAMVLVLYRPVEILSPGFIFSFMVVAFIVMVYGSVPKHMMTGNWFRVYCVGLVITSLAANLASIPLSALLFGMFSPVSLIGNLIVVPLTFCIVLAGWLSILLPLASEIFNHAAVIFINLLLKGVAWLDAVPGSSWMINPPSVLSVLLWFGCLIYYFCHADTKVQKRYALTGAGLAVLLALLS